jgi:hypothetical protein
MNRIVSIAALIAALAVPLIAQQTDSTVIATLPERAEPTRVFYGGTLGMSFGNTFRVSVQPFVGWVFTTKISGGLKVGYEYIREENTNTGVATIWNNYGASVFGRYRFIPRAYLHAEFAELNYGYTISEFTSDRYWVPFIFLGGGYVQPISPGASLFFEVLFDVLQDSKSPYEDWSPWISVGVAVGF